MGDLHEVSFAESYCCQSRHHPDQMIDKTVTYFVSEIESVRELIPQVEEVSDL